MDINQLKYFISVAETLNFTEAARRNGLTQPAISHHIGELEKSLGSKLFIRNRRSVTLTKSGQKFLPYAVEMVEIAEKAAFQIKQLEEGFKGHISIAALTTSSAVLSRCLSAFSSKYPDINVDINFTSGRSQVIAMNKAKYDFHFAVKEMVPAGETFDYLVSHRDRLVMAVPSNHPLANKPLDFSQLHNERFVTVTETDGPALFNEIMKVCSARGYKPKITCQYDRAEAVLLSVGAGLGIAIIPEALSKTFYSENVTFKEIPGDDTFRTYVIAWHRDMTNPAAQLFLRVVKELFDDKK
ncbi:MAG: LysR family transcriptional regulator [Peptococcaceae bacterium]|nr:LysR family transcriptional regulator [Peptococcaceae bacterium]